MALILVIEDAMLSRKMICRALQREGYSTIEAANGFEGIEMTRTHHPDCIILDMLMPDMDGREVLKYLQDQKIQIPVIVVTADIQKTTRQQCIELGAITVLNKIVEQKELGSWVEKALSLTQENSS